MTETPASDEHRDDDVLLAGEQPPPGRDWGRVARRGAIGVAIAIAIVVAGLYITDTIRVRPVGPSFAESTDAVRSLDAARDAAAQLAGRSEPVRELSNEHPLRLYVAGDSHVGIVGRELGAKVEKTGVVAAHVDFRESSGISNGAVRDWFGHAREQLAARDPEAVVFMIGSNDTAIVGGPGRDGATAEWEQRYRERVGDMMDLLSGTDARTSAAENGRATVGSDDATRMVIWVGVPPLRNEAFDRGAEELNRIMREEARRRDAVVFFDAYALFAAPSGGWTATTTVDDATVRVRNGDGIHFTRAGGQHLADHILRVLDAHWHISEFADPDHPIGFGVDAGSSCVAACAGYTPPAPSTGGSTAVAPEPPTTTTTSAPTHDGSNDVAPDDDAGAPPGSGAAPEDDSDDADDGAGDPTTDTTAPTTPTTTAPTPTSAAPTPTTPTPTTPTSTTPTTAPAG